jgi:glycosyltransferase involved in cell wall biosynthesis
VATRIAGVPRLVQDGSNGLLVSSNNFMELSEKIGRLWRQPLLRENLSLAGRQTIVERFSFAARMDRVRALYDRLVGDRRRGTFP